MSSVIFDASAMLALIQDEKGVEIAEAALPYAVMSAVNLSEVSTLLIKVGISRAESEMITANLIQHVIPFDQEQAHIAAELANQTKEFGLSLGDRACLSLAKQKKWPVLTADKIWKKINIGVDIQLIR